MWKNLKIEEKKILTYLIGNLNENGFLDIDAEEVASVFSVSQDEIEDLIQLLQSLDPIGVGAKNLTECLLIQIREHQKENTLAYMIVENSLTDLADKRYKKIAELYGVPIQKVQEAADFIRTLNPRPVSHFSNDLTHYIVPDVFLKKEKDIYSITVNDKLMPKLSINAYYTTIQETNSSESTKDYVKENFNHAQLLIKGLELRKVTLYRVTTAILEEQQEFFQKGMSGLKPMTLKYISEKLNLHESTISRATSNKYIQTPHGLFKMKSFFTRGLTRVNSEETESATIIKEKIKVLIADEDKVKPFSDQKLCQIFETAGTKISRRTIAKYREDLGIPGSSKRRRF